jgi:heme exporter protein C
MLVSETGLRHVIVPDSEHPGWNGYGSPQGFYPLTRLLLPWIAAAALIACVTGLYLGVFVAQVDPRLGGVARIAFIHVPASLVSMSIYVATLAAAGIGLAYKARLAAMAAQALAPTGLTFTFLGLWTGCLWGKAIAETWWVWDLPTYLDLMLALLYSGFIGLHIAMEDLHRANKAGALLLLAGVVSIPLNIAAVHSWTAQHQAALPGAASATGASAGEIASLLALSLGFLLYAAAAALLRLRCVILERERGSDWVARRGSHAK